MLDRAHMTVVTSAFSISSFFAVHTKTPSRRFQINPLWRTFSKRSVLGGRKRCFGVDERSNRTKQGAFSNLSGLVCMGLELGNPCLVFVSLMNNFEYLRLLFYNLPLTYRTLGVIFERHRLILSRPRNPRVIILNIWITYTLLIQSNQVILLSVEKWLLFLYLWKWNNIGKIGLATVGQDERERKRAYKVYSFHYINQFKKSQELT